MFLSRIFKRKEKHILLIKFDECERHDSINGFLEGINKKLRNDYHIISILKSTENKDIEIQCLPKVSDEEFNNISNRLKNIHEDYRKNKPITWINV